MGSPAVAVGHDPVCAQEDSATLAWRGMGSIAGLTSAASSKGYKVFAVISHLPPATIKALICG